MDEVKYTPLKMQPCYKSYLWGGCRLKKEYGKLDAPDIAAESWELAVHADGMSRVKDGVLAGMTIAQLGQIDHNGFWGENCARDTFPVMVKLIDAREDLSIQVHPSDAAAMPERGEHGKAELWYIVDCEPRSSIYCGFLEKTTEEGFRARAENGSICDILNKVPVSKGDVFFIMPGTIHAIGKGIVIAEIQQNSNTTFRVFDYLRCGADGKPRTLHLERAQKVLNYQPILPEECKAVNSGVFTEFTVTEMFSCSYFRAFRVDVRESVCFKCDGLSFQHLLCVEGDGRIVHDGACYPFGQGDSYFLPAKLGSYQVIGKCRMLLTKI